MSTMAQKASESRAFLLKESRSGISGEEGHFRQKGDGKTMREEVAGAGFVRRRGQRRDCGRGGW